jgi:hypothetical protein
VLVGAEDLELELLVRARVDDAMELGEGLDVLAVDVEDAVTGFAPSRSSGIAKLTS